jgi:cytoplasmic tRNA 2-thiolation protein 1
MRGDVARLGRCTAVTTQSEDTIKRSKPFKYAYEKEIVMYAYFKKLTYFSTECIYSPDGMSLFWAVGGATDDLAYRGHARVFLKDLEAIRPSAIIDIIHSGESFVLEQSVQKGMKAMRELLRLLNFPASVTITILTSRNMLEMRLHGFQRFMCMSKLGFG